MLRGDKCVLRPLKLEDAKILAEIGNNLEVKKFLRDVFPFSEVGAEEFIRRVNSQPSPPSSIVFGVEVDGKLVGLASLSNINWISRNCYFSIAIYDPAYWNKGIGTEATKLIVSYAFEFLNMHKILLEVYEYNERAIHVYEKIGFKVEGRLRKNHYYNGRYHDTIVMGILAEEYFQSGDKGGETFERESDDELRRVIDRLGTLVEDIFYPSFDIAIKKHFGIDLESKSLNVWRKKNGKSMEIDLVGVGGGKVFVLEVKATPDKDEYIDRFVEKLREFFDYFPEYRGLKMIPIYGSWNMKEETVKRLSELGIYAMIVRGDVLEIVNMDEVKR